MPWPMVAAHRWWEVCISKVEQTGHMGRVSIKENSHLCWSSGGEDWPPACEGGAEGAGRGGTTSSVGQRPRCLLAICRGQLGRRHNSGPQAGRLPRGKLIVSPLWRLKRRRRVSAGLVSPEGSALCLACARPPSGCCFAWSVPCARAPWSLSAPGLSPLIIHQTDWPVPTEAPL